MLGQNKLDLRQPLNTDIVWEFEKVSSMRDNAGQPGGRRCGIFGQDNWRHVQSSDFLREKLVKGDANTKNRVIYWEMYYVYEMFLVYSECVINFQIAY